MIYIKKSWEWIIKHIAFIISGLLIFLWVWGIFKAQEIETRQANSDFKCQTLCFPQQHEYLYVGDLGSCWCYETKSTLKKLEN